MGAVDSDGGGRSLVGHPLGFHTSKIFSQALSFWLLSLSGWHPFCALLGQAIRYTYDFGMILKKGFFHLSFTNCPSVEGGVRMLA